MEVTYGLAGVRSVSSLGRQAKQLRLIKVINHNENAVYSQAMVANKGTNSEHSQKKKMKWAEDQLHAYSGCYPKGRVCAFRAKLGVCVELEDALVSKAVIPVFGVPGNKLPALVVAPVHFLGC